MKPGAGGGRDLLTPEAPIWRLPAAAGPLIPRLTKEEYARRMGMKPEGPGFFPFLAPSGRPGSILLSTRRGLPCVTRRDMSRDFCDQGKTA